VADTPTRDRKFNEEEVALIIKRAAELQQTEQTEQDPGNALTLTEVEQIAKEAGIDPRLIRRAALGLEQPETTNRPSPWVGAPTRIVFERVIDGEVPTEEFEALVEETRRTLGQNGIPSVLGRSLAWSSTMSGGRRRASGRQVDVSIVPRGGVTTIRVEEELGNVAGALFGGIVGGGGGGTSGAVVGASIAAFHSAPITIGLLVCSLSAFYMLARTIYGSIAGKREKQLLELIGRLEEITQSAISRRSEPRATTRPIGSGDAAKGLLRSPGE
jgi:hypothetical protein